MKYLIDYENVHFAGLEGATFLSKEDEVEIFYNENSNISKGMVKALKEKCKSVNAHKLIESRPNALDFYIASRIGEMVGDKESGMFCIITKDENMAGSIKDYWNNGKKAKVTSAVSVIAHLKEEEKRLVGSMNNKNNKVKVSTVFNTQVAKAPKNKSPKKVVQIDESLKFFSR